MRWARQSHPTLAAALAMLLAIGVSASPLRAAELLQKSVRVSTPAGLDARGQQAFATYLDSDPDKAFAIGEGGHFGWSSGRLSSEEAKRAALYFCANSGAMHCAIVNLNNDPAR